MKDRTEEETKITQQKKPVQKQQDISKKFADFSAKQKQQEQPQQAIQQQKPVTKNSTQQRKDLIKQGYEYAIQQGVVFNQSVIKSYNELLNTTDFRQISGNTKLTKELFYLLADRQQQKQLIKELGGIEKDDFDLSTIVGDTDGSDRGFDSDETMITSRIENISGSVLYDIDDDVRDKITDKLASKLQMTSDQKTELKIKTNLDNIINSLNLQQKNIDMSDLSGNQKTVTINGKYYPQKLVQQEIQKLALQISRQSGNIFSKKQPFKKVLKLQQKEQTKFKPTLNQLFQTRKVMC